MEKANWEDLGFQQAGTGASGAPKAKEGHEPPPRV